MYLLSGSLAVFVSVAFPLCVCVIIQQHTSEEVKDFFPCGRNVSMCKGNSSDEWQLQNRIRVLHSYIYIYIYIRVCASSSDGLLFHLHGSKAGLRQNLIWSHSSIAPLFT